jgi:hypothetical protein
MYTTWFKIEIFKHLLSLDYSPYFYQIPNISIYTIKTKKNKNIDIEG